MKVFRKDNGRIHSSSKTQEGFLDVYATVTRTGVFVYQNQDGSLRRELRHPSEIFSKKSLDSMKMIPVTNLHPPEKLVTSDNVKKLSVGNVGETVAPNGMNIDASFVIQDQSAIDAVMAGRNQLSLGYELDLVKKSGEFDGERYDYMQTNVVYNHLALVSDARAGSEARIVLDSADAIQVKKEQLKESKKKEIQMKTVKVRLDNGCEYENVPQEVAAALENSKSRVDSVSKDLASKTSELKTATEKVDKLQADVDAYKAQNNDEAIKEAVKAHSELVSKAAPRLDEDTVKNLHEMSQKEIKIAVIKKSDKDFNADGKSDAYIDARFDIVLEQKADNDSAIQNQRRQIHGDGGGTNDDNKSPREKYIDRLVQAGRK